MAQLETVNLVFGASQSAPNTISYNQAVILTKLAEQFNAGNITGSCSGWITVDRLYKSQYVLLRNLGVNIASPTFENCLDDNFTIDSILNKTIYEGQSIALSSNNISNDVLTYSMNSSTDIAIVSKDETTTDSYIKGRINLRNNSIVVQAASQNDSWTARVTVHATPTYNYIDNNGQRQIVQGNSVATVLTVTATAVTNIVITGPDMVNAGETVVYNATLRPAASTKIYSSVTWTSLQDGFINNSNSYKINGDNPTDTITATVTLYGSTLNASKNITLGVELLNDTDKNPQMFAIIKSALNLNEDVHSFSVVDAMNADNDDADAIFTALTNNTTTVTNHIPKAPTQLYDFSEFKYFTNVTGIRLNDENANLDLITHSRIAVNKIIFPDSLKKIIAISFPWIDGNFDTKNIVLWKITGRGNTVIKCTGTLRFSCTELKANANSLYVYCDTITKIPDSCSHEIIFNIDINDSFDLTNVEYYDLNNIVFTLRNADTVILPENITSIPIFAESHCLQYFRVNNIDSVNLPSKINTLKNQAFKNCISLAMTDITNIKTIGNQAFSGCVNLNIQQLGTNIVSIDTEAFKGCIGCFTNNKIEINFANTVSSVSLTTFSRLIFTNKVIKIFGNGITTIKANTDQNSANAVSCFYDLRNLTHLTSCSLSGAVSSSYVTPFIDFTNINRLISLTNSSIQDNIQRIYVPDVLLSQYKAATNWSNYADRIYGKSQFVADALATGVGDWDSENNEWITHPYDDDYTYGLPTWTLAADV